VNEPTLFSQFVQKARESKLRYLGDARVGTMFPAGLGEGPRQALRFVASDQIELEQYLDFLRNRAFRQTLLCHPDAPVNWHVLPENVLGLHVASGAVPEGEPAATGHVAAATSHASAPCSVPWPAVVRMSLTTAGHAPDR